ASDTKCYRQMISSGATVVMGLLASSGTQALSKAGIASFMITDTVQDNASPWQTSIIPGNIGVFASAARYLCANGAKNVSIMRDDDPLKATAFAALAAGIYQHCGIKTNIVTVPYGTADLAPYVTKAVQGKPDALQALVVEPAQTIANAVTSAGYPMSKTLMTPIATSSFFSNPKTNGLMVQSAGQLPLPSNPNRDVQSYLKFMKSGAGGADPSAQLSLPGFQMLTTIWQAGKAIGFNKLTGRALVTYMNTKAAGRLHITASRVISKVPGAAGLKQPYVHFYRWNESAKKLVDGGWW